MSEEYETAKQGFIIAAAQSGSGVFAKANPDEAAWMMKMVEAINETFRVSRAIEEQARHDLP